MKTYDFRQPPFKIYGVPFFAQTGRMQRLPSHITAQLPPEFVNWQLSGRCPGARLCFRTNSREIGLHIDFERITPDIGMSIYSCQSANVFIGPRQTARYAGLARPDGYHTPFAKGTFHKDHTAEDITIFLPRNEIITGIQITLEDDAAVEAPTAYKHPVPILYYGSSVTEGACCSKPANAYNALLSRWLDADFINFGFSGSAKGELLMADYIYGIEKSILVMDYDHNAPTLEHLQHTHAPFFEYIRSRQPLLPIVFMSASNFEWLNEAAQRRQIIRSTYEAALQNGDKNVYFVDGETLWGSQDRDACSADALHPNDLGMYRTAQVLAPILQEILDRPSK